MSKKDKSKFKKLIKAQLQQEMAQAQKEISPNKPTQSVVISNNVVPNAFVATTNVSPEVIGEINLPQIKYDLKKTGIVVGAIALIIVALYFLNNQYNILSNFGDHLFRVLHIQ